MKKFLTLVMAAALLALTASSCAFADATVSINRYQCMICERYYFSFEGDDLDTEKINDPDKQLGIVFQLEDRGKNLEACGSNFKAHVFELTGTSLQTMSWVAKNMSKIAVIRDGKPLSKVKITEWYCKFKDYGCGSKWPVYTLNDDDLNIRDWELQPSMLIAMKGSRGISKCNGNRYGHAFPPKNERNTQSVTSYQIATILRDLFYVKN